ncbi:MAG: exodeoxyribonuclease VII large subunit, partial [Bryobacteraceae bacterium]|nr:exodeoxyribonuclease VII large subunit [Bryobacteraceae bacterium]
MSTQYSLSLGPPTYSVSEINGAIRETLQSEFRGVWVEGEITEAKMAPSGHWYFSLKDAQSKIKCACFKSQAWKL